jgi:hypothetical protein
MLELPYSPAEMFPSCTGGVVTYWAAAGLLCRAAKPRMKSAETERRATEKKVVMGIEGGISHKFAKKYFVLSKRGSVQCPKKEKLPWLGIVLLRAIPSVRREVFVA